MRAIALLALALSGCICVRAVSPQHLVSVRVIYVHSDRPLSKLAPALAALWSQRATVEQREDRLSASAPGMRAELRPRGAQLELRIASESVPDPDIDLARPRALERDLLSLSGVRRISSDEVPE